MGLQPEELERFLTSLKGRVMAGKELHIPECLAVGVQDSGVAEAGIQGALGLLREISSLTWVRFTPGQVRGGKGVRRAFPKAQIPWDGLCPSLDRGDPFFLRHPRAAPSSAAPGQSGCPIPTDFPIKHQGRAPRGVLGISAHQAQLHGVPGLVLPSDSNGEGDWECTAVL